jgi:hypothetical protein
MVRDRAGRAACHRLLERPQAPLMWTAPRVNCQLQHAPRYAITAGHGARRSVPYQAPACRVHGARPSPPPQFSSSDGIRHRQIEPVPPDARLRIMALRATRDGHASRRGSNRARYEARATADCIYEYQYCRLYGKAVADVDKNRSALVRGSGQLRPYVRPVMRHSPLAIMGVRLRVRHRSLSRARSTDACAVLPELS